MRKKYFWTPCTAEMSNLVNRSLFLDHKQRHNRNHFQPQEMLEYERQHQMTVNAVTKTTKTSARKKTTRYSYDVGVCRLGAACSQCYFRFESF